MTDARGARAACKGVRGLMPERHAGEGFVARKTWHRCVVPEAPACALTSPRVPTTSPSRDLRDKLGVRNEVVG